jgi:hypothetical protein
MANSIVACPALKKKASERNRRTSVTTGLDLGCRHSYVEITFGAGRNGSKEL